MKLRADFMLLLCATFWGGTFVAIELAITEMPPYMMVALRFSVAAVCFFPFFLLMKKREWHLLKQSREESADCAGQDNPAAGGWRSVGAGFLLGLVSFAGYGLQTQGLIYTTPARSAFITQLLILFTFPMQILFLRRKVIPSAFVGLMFVLLGAYFLLGSPAGGSWNAGDWLTIACAFSFALLIILLDVFSRRFSGADLTFYQILTTGVVAGLASTAGMDEAYLEKAGYSSIMDANRFFASLKDPVLLMSLLYLAIPATIGTVLIQVRYQKETSPARASLLYAMEPVFAGIFAFLILQQFLGWTESFGALLIVIGVIVSEAFSSTSKTLSSKKPDHQKSGD